MVCSYFEFQIATNKFSSGIKHKTFDFYKWFSNERPADLDDDFMNRVRYCISNKIAEIACQASEKIVDTDAFKKLPKQDKFTMVVANRTAGVPPRFYPFNS